MGTFALIPARGGSKGIPRKNIKPIAGKPLIAWTIEAALRSPLLDAVVVSTEDEEIADVALFLASRLIVMSPRPGRITHTYELDFNRRFLKDGNARAIKSSAEFIEMRETILGIIYGDERAVQKDVIHA